MRNAILLCLALSACAATPQTLVVDPVTLSGNWRIVAVNGRSTPDRPSYNLRLGRYGTAQFGCNVGSGNYRTAPGWLIPTSEWIITVAGCRPDWPRWYDDRGWKVLASPMTVERRSAGYRLKNKRGTIDIRAE